MPLLIDCYNVLHAEKPPRLAGLTTAWLCRALARSRWAGQPILVVCDGQASPLELVESPVAAVELTYSGPERTADQVIIQQIERDTGPKRLLVVSSDHEILKAARRRRAKTLTSEQFLHELARQLNQPGHSPREPDKPDPSDMPQAEIDAWLQQFGYEPSQKPAPPPQPRDLSPETDPDVPWPPPDVERD
jgi:predicted RNA-binding protein with PIN domain